MERTDRKNEWRRAQAIKIREERIISGYVETKYPEIYAEAAAFYNVLNKKHPSKRDLRKTDDYHVWKASIKPKIVKPSSGAKTYPNIKKATYVDIESSSATKKYGDNFQLKIPLMTYERKPAKTPESCQETDVTQAGLDEEIEKIMAELRQDPCLGRFFSDLNSPAELIESIQDPPVPIEPAEIVIQSTLSGEIPSEVLENIVTGLREDPHLDSIFEDMDIENSPLEDELELW